MKTTNKSLPAWRLPPCFLKSKYVNKNLYARCAQLVFNQQGHTPRVATISPSEAIAIIEQYSFINVRNCLSLKSVTSDVCR